MQFIEKSCRVCLTTEDDEKFKTINVGDEIWTKIFGLYKIDLSDDSAIICRSCVLDIDTAWKVFKKIHDADEYFKFYAQESSRNDKAGIPGSPTLSAVDETSKASKKKAAGTKESDTTKEAVGSKAVVCCACSSSFSTMAALDEHCRTGCEFESSIFLSIFWFAISAVYTCFLCDFMFVTVEECNEHAKKMHNLKAGAINKISSMRCNHEKRNLLENLKI